MNRNGNTVVTITTRLLCNRCHLQVLLMFRGQIYDNKKVLQLPIVDTDVTADMCFDVLELNNRTASMSDADDV